jgi:cbb3-type cytochrome oxidase subunit 3
MKFIKFLLFLLGIGVGLWLLFWLIGLLSGLLWYAFWIAILGLGGYAGYKLFLEKDDEPPQLAEKTPIGIAEMKDIERQLEEFNKKYK